MSSFPSRLAMLSSSSRSSSSLSSSNKDKESSALYNNDTTVNTQKALRIIDDQILPYQQLGFVWTNIEVFWLPLRGYDKEHRNNNGTSRAKKKSRSSSSKECVNGRNAATLKAARPPDSYGTGVVSEWRWCHMGVILVAEQSSNTDDDDEDSSSHGDIDDDDVKSNKENMQLRVLLDLHNSGIRIHHVFAEAKKAQSKMNHFLWELMCGANNDVSVFSAGVNEAIMNNNNNRRRKRKEVQSLETLTEVVQIVKSYNVAFFNCQHFTSIAYYHFTGMHLSQRLRHRWTNSHRHDFISSWRRMMMNNSNSNNNNTTNGADDTTAATTATKSITSYCSSTNNKKNNNKKKTKEQQHPLLHNDFIDTMTKNPCLQKLQLVDHTENELLLSYTPKLFGKSNRTAAIVGGALMVAAALPVTAGLAVTAMGLGYDKIHPRLCPLSRVTIWFRYDGSSNEREWFWSPYRYGEEQQDQEKQGDDDDDDDDDDDRCWMSVRQNRVRSGRYQGQELQNTSARIVECLNAFHPNPLLLLRSSSSSSSTTSTIWNWDCPICWKSCTEYSEKVMCGPRCAHAICRDCYERMTKRQILHCPFCRKPFEERNE